MSYDFQTILVSKVSSILKISATGSNCYVDPDSMITEDFTNTAPVLYCGSGGLECILIYDADLLNYYVFFWDYKAPEGKERWITTQQALDKGYNLDRIFSIDSGNLTIYELEFGPLPNKYLKLLIELNVAATREVSISEDELRAILL